MELRDVLGWRDASNPVVRRIAAGLHAGDGAGSLIRGDDPEERMFVPVTNQPGDAEWVEKNKNKPKLVRFARVGGVEVATVVVNRGAFENAAPTVQALFLQSALEQFVLIADALEAGRFSLDDGDKRTMEVWHAELLEMFWEMRRRRESFRREVDPAFDAVDMEFAAVDRTSRMFASVADNLILELSRVTMAISEELGE